MKTIVYGLGGMFARYNGYIHKNYHVVGYCDRDISKLEKIETGRFYRSMLMERQELYDSVLVTVFGSEATRDILKDLVDNLNIPCNKIRFLHYDMLDKEKPYISFGQYGEDLSITCALKAVFPNFSEIRYLEIGTNHPVYGNNTFMMYRLGMRGTLVDPLPWVGYASSIYRKEDDFIQGAVTDFAEKDTTNFYICNAADAVSSLSESQVDKVCRKHNMERSIQNIEVKLYGINDILAKFKTTPEVLLIDAEGFDYKILKAIDFNKYTPAIIMAEIRQNDMKQFMENNGYVQVIDNILTEVNAVFYRKDIWEKVNKYYQKLWLE